MHVFVIDSEARPPAKKRMKQGMFGVTVMSIIVAILIIRVPIAIYYYKHAVH